MKLANCISDLLYRYNCVIVPDFGGFITNKIGVKKHYFTHTFYPPTKQITFNAHLKNNDGLLINYISSIENISFEKALENVALIVSKWQNELQFKSIEIASIGFLSLNNDNQIVFEPNTSVNYLTESFGLNLVESPAIKRVKNKQEIPLFPSKERKKGIPLFVKYAATIAIVLTLGTLGWNKIQQKNVFVKQQEALEQKIQKATFVIDNPLPTINLNVNKIHLKRYHIVAGAFQFKRNAEKKVLQLKKQGFNAKNIGKNKWGLTQVVFNSFETRKEALKQLRNIKKNVSKDAWLFVQKIN